MTTVSVRQARPLNYSSFEHITDVALLSFVGGSLVFDGDLTPEQACNVWWFATSRDAADETARRNLAALKAAADTADLSTPEGLTALREYAVALGDYTLGEVP